MSDIIRFTFEWINSYIADQVIIKAAKVLVKLDFHKFI